MSAPLRLNIGSGPFRVDGWVHVDLACGDVIADVRRPLPFPSNSASHIYASHILEHLRNPDEVYAFLGECRRVLRRGGKVRIVVPNIAAYLRAVTEGEESFWVTHSQTWPWSRLEGRELASMDAGVTTPARLRVLRTPLGPSPR